MVVGAGDAGALVVREMQRDPQLKLRPVAFVHDNPEKLKNHIHRVRVAGTLDELAKVLRCYLAQEVVIAIPSAAGMGKAGEKLSEALWDEGLDYEPTVQADLTYLL